MDELLKRLDKIEQHLASQGLMLKDVLNFDEGCEYLNLSQSHVYKLTSTGAIPCYKPMGKKIYFKRVELDQWLLRNRSNTVEEIEAKAGSFQLKNGGTKS